MEKQGSTTTRTYTYGNALIRMNSETPLFDGLGSTRTVTGSNGSVQGSATYEAFGQAVATTVCRHDGDRGRMQMGQFASLQEAGD